jgi:hypothetical protein
MESRLQHAYFGYLEYQVKCNLKNYNGEIYETFFNIFGTSITIEPHSYDSYRSSDNYILKSNTDNMNKIFIEHLGDDSFCYLSKNEIKRKLDKLVKNGVNIYGDCVKVIM